MPKPRKPIPKSEDAWSTPERRGEEARELMKRIRQCAGQVQSDAESKFLNDLESRMAQYRSRFTVTQKQLFWLRDILGR